LIALGIDVDQAEADRDRHHQHEGPADRRIARVDDNVEAAVEAAQPRERQQELDDRSDEDRDGVDVELGRDSVRPGHADDEAGDDREVPEDRRERRHREVLVAVQDPDDHPRQAQQHDDREQHARKAHRQRAVAEHAHDPRRDHDEERCDATEAE